MKTERQTPEDKIAPNPEEWINASTYNGERLFGEDIDIVKKEDAIKALQLLKDQHNKELKEIREELENTKTELAAYKLLRSVYHDKFVKILEVIHNQVSVEHAELLDKHIK